MSLFIHVISAESSDYAAALYKENIGSAQTTHGTNNPSPPSGKLPEVILQTISVPTHAEITPEQTIFNFCLTLPSRIIECIVHNNRNNTRLDGIAPMRLLHYSAKALSIVADKWKNGGAPSDSTRAQRVYNKAGGVLNV